MTSKKITKAVAVEKESGPTIYIGPSLPNGQLTRNTVFKQGKMQPHIEKLIADLPALKALIVPVSELAKIEKKLSNSASVEASRFAEIKKHFSKGAR